MTSRCGGSVAPARRTVGNRRPRYGAGEHLVGRVGAAIGHPRGGPGSVSDALYEPPKRRPNRLMMEADTAIGPRERKPRKVPSPAST